MQNRLPHPLSRETQPLCRQNVFSEPSLCLAGNQLPSMLVRRRRAGPVHTSGGNHIAALWVYGRDSGMRTSESRVCLGTSTCCITSGQLSRKVRGCFDSTPQLGFRRCPCSALKPVGANSSRRSGFIPKRSRPKPGPVFIASARALTGGRRLRNYSAKYIFNYLRPSNMPGGRTDAACSTK